MYKTTAFICDAKYHFKERNFDQLSKIGQIGMAILANLLLLFNICCGLS